MINLGDKVKDSVTGFVGIVTARTEWLNGCIRLAVQGPLKDGKVPDTEHFDETQLVLVKSKVVPSLVSRTGGPRPDEKRAFVEPSKPWPRA